MKEPRRHVISVENARNMKSAVRAMAAAVELERAAIRDPAPKPAPAAKFARGARVKAS